MKNKNYGEILNFYQTLWELIGIGSADEEKTGEFPQWLAEMLILQFEKIKNDISVTEFTMETAKKVYVDFDLREGFAECAFKDLAPHLRDPEAMEIVRNHFAISGTDTTDDIYVHVRNVRPLEIVEGDGAVVVTMVVDSYETFKAWLDGNGPDHAHVSYGAKAQRVE